MVKIEISKIQITSNNSRKEFDVDRIKQIGESILKYGQLHQIIVRSLPNGLYELVTGEMRVRGCESVGLTEIEADIRDLTDLECKKLRIIENIHRTDLSAYERGDAVAELWDTGDYKSMKDLAEDLGVSSDIIVNNWLAQSRKLSEKCKNYISKKMLRDYQVQKMIRYPHDIQDKLADIIIKYTNPDPQNRYSSDNPTLKTPQKFRAFMNEFGTNPNMSIAEIESLVEKYAGIKPSNMVTIFAPKTTVTPEQEKYLAPKFKKKRQKVFRKELDKSIRCKNVNQSTGKQCNLHREPNSEYCKQHLHTGPRGPRVMREQAKALKEEEKPVIPQGEFNVIYADPPWKYDFSPTYSRSIESHYSTMELEEIKNMKVPSSKDSILFLWATSPKLQEALEVMKAWGFKYLTTMVWVKDKIGMGYYVREKHELLLIGKKGDIPVPEPTNRPSSVLESPRREHSQKPEDMYIIIERMYPHGKYLELFSRHKRERWTTEIGITEISS